ncbi:unnamed protein product [Citrullus colocynthis]|uniref:Uncharacterized protein n=1 Tax=Citrullus colocynthis TaxID=252529 RepID=A0ABP0Y5K5_9ROSI
MQLAVKNCTALERPSLETVRIPEKESLESQADVNAVNFSNDEDLLRKEIGRGCLFPASEVSAQGDSIFKKSAVENSKAAQVLSPVISQEVQQSLDDLVPQAPIHNSSRLKTCALGSHSQLIKFEKS